MKVEHVYFNYTNKEILNDVSFEFTKERLILIGLNGEGKTTLANLIMGLLKPKEGQISVEEEIRMCYSENILPEYVSIYDIIVSQNLDEQKLDNLLQYFNCIQYKFTFIKDLSFGTSKKMNLILTYMQKCDVIILDEPTTGLDVISQMNLIKLIKNDKRMYFVITHDFNLIKEISNRVLILNNTKINEINYHNEVELKNVLEKYANNYE